MTTTKLILKSGLSPGDIVMLTAAVRDLHAAYPGEYVTDVRTPCGALWEHNPLITKLADDDPEARHIQCEYPLIHRSNQTPHHFIHGYRMHLEKELGRPIPPGAFRGDIYLSAEERGWMSQVEETEGKGARFWIIVSGGKTDFTAKIWETARFQEVVDRLAGKVRFVQVGEAGHQHPALRGVLDLRGKTNLRQLVRLVHHADGIVCPVTSLMHLAAAVPTKNGGMRPCVVIAGGREPSQWEAYPGHRYLDTIGSLPCCSTGGCWKSRVVALGDGDKKDQSLCVRPIATPSGQTIPQCLDLVTVDAVVRAVESYLVVPVAENVREHASTLSHVEQKPCGNCGSSKVVGWGKDDPRAWGPDLWRKFHTRADLPGLDLLKEPAWLEKLMKVVPCEECRTHFAALLADSPPNLADAEGYFAWGVGIHNRVNERLGKPVMTLESARAIRMTEKAKTERRTICLACEHFAKADAKTPPLCKLASEPLNPMMRNMARACPAGKWGAVEMPKPAKRIMFIACNATYEAGHKIGDMITMAFAARLMAKNEPHDHYILALNPRHPLNFVFDQFVKDFSVDVILDDWPAGQQSHRQPEFERRRKERTVNGVAFTTYKELYRRMDGSARQTLLCGREKGLGRRNIFEYYFFGQESSPPECSGSVNFGPEAFGWRRNQTEPDDSVFVAPHAVSQGNGVFTMEFWKEVIDLLLAAGLRVTVNTPNAGRFGTHDRLTYSFQHNNLPALFDQVSRQRLVLCGNTGIGWIAAANGVPLIAGEPPHFWFMDYRYREAGVRSVVDIFSKPEPDTVCAMVLKYLKPRRPGTSETSRCRDRLAPFCEGSGIDIGFGGDPIKPDSITMDQPRPYTRVGDSPQHLRGTCHDLKWFKDGALDYVFSSHLLEDFPYKEQREILAEWLRVIRPGGRVVLYQPDQQRFLAHCRHTGQGINLAHKEADYSLDAFSRNVLPDDRFLAVKIVHCAAVVENYSWEIVLEKTTESAPPSATSR